MSYYLVGIQTAQLCGNKSLSSELLKPRAHGQKEHWERTWEMNQFSSECSWPSQASGIRLYSATGVSGGLNAPDSQILSLVYYLFQVREAGYPYAWLS